MTTLALSKPYGTYDRIQYQTVNFDLSVLKSLVTLFGYLLLIGLGTVAGLTVFFGVYFLAVTFVVPNLVNILIVSAVFVTFLFIKP